MPYKLENAERLKLVNAKKLLAEADEACRKGAACGFDMQAQDMATQALRDKIDAIEREFTNKRKE